MKEVIAVCKKNGNGKLISVEIDNQNNLESIQDVINNMNRGIKYKIKNGDDIISYDHDDRIRSHKNGKENDNLRNLDDSSKC